MSDESIRAQALRRLEDFSAKAGSAYAGGRNFDHADMHNAAVSGLSAFIRYRVISETEVLNAVLQKHSVKQADKFIQEVCWRTYWKGWLQQRPEIWLRYTQQLDQLQDKRQQDEDLNRRLHAAVQGKTGIDCFDAWAEQLNQTGYLHNHARMWLASIWIFTLRLPWQLGADWFMQQLLDGDAASNTLSWRWVAGLHTKGKHYLARAENIEKYTQGRFYPRGQLNENAAPLPPEEIDMTALLRPLPDQPKITDRASCLLLHEDDLSFVPEQEMRLFEAVACKRVVADNRSAKVTSFVTQAAREAVATASKSGKIDALSYTDASGLIETLHAGGIAQVIAPFAPIGTNASDLNQLRQQLSTAGIDLLTPMRRWDQRAWPHARKGFFAFKKHIPSLLQDLGGQRPLL